MQAVLRGPKIRQTIQILDDTVSQEYETSNYCGDQFYLLKDKVTGRWPNFLEIVGNQIILEAYNSGDIGTYSIDLVTVLDNY